MADIKKASIYYRNNILYKINDEFIQLTGHTYGKIIGKTLSELSEMLKAKIDDSFESAHLLYKGYIFTNKDEPKYVEITCEDSYKKDEKIYSFKESSSEFLKGLLATCTDNPEDKSEAIAIYSYPELIHLKVNKNYMNKQRFFRPKDTELLGSTFIPTIPEMFDDIREKGYFYKIIAQNCYRAIKLINNISDISIIEGSFYELTLENKNIVNIVEDIVLSVSDYIKGRKLTVIFDPKIEEKVIALDAHRFEKVMLNLLSNAIKFSKDNGIIFVDLIEKDNFIEISVKDQGIGINEKNIDYIFKKFKQENKSLNRRAEGTITAESNVDIGSKFTVRLPLKTVDKSINTESNCSFEDRLEMIKFEFSDIYS